MGKLHALMPRMGGRSPERAALAEAIEQNRQYSVELGAALKAEETAAENLAAAEAHQKVAAAAYEAAKGAEVEALTAQTLTGVRPASAGPTMRELRADLSDAVDAVEVARGVLAALRGRRVEKEQSGKFSRDYAIQNAVNAVMEPAGLALLQEVEALQRLLVRKRLVLKHAPIHPKGAGLLRRIILPGEPEHFGRDQYGRPMPEAWDPDWAVGATDDWNAWRTALMTDPDAVLSVSDA